MGIVNCDDSVEEGSFGVVKVTGYARNIAGISVIPASTKPFTPVFVLSKAFSCVERSIAATVEVIDDSICFFF